MHPCPECGEYCDCDGEDLHHDVAPDDCAHECPPEDDDDLDYDDDWRTGE